MSARPPIGFTVSGPGLDKRYIDEGPALSRAVTAATRAETTCAYYVRDAGGEVTASAERVEGRVVVRRP